MKLSVLPLALLVGFTATVCAQESLKTEKQKTLYALGVALGRNISDFNLTPGEVKYVLMGFKDSAGNAALKVNMQEYGPKVGAFAQSHQEAKASGEKAKSKKFLQEAAKEKGAVKTASGLIYVSLQDGTGASPKATDKVKVHYTGTLTDGKVFDSSVQRGQPAEFSLNEVIPCWTEGLQKMKVGGKAKLICPSSIAYGDQGHPPVIPGGATLVFEVQLLDILK